MPKKGVEPAGLKRYRLAQKRAGRSPRRSSRGTSSPPKRKGPSYHVVTPNKVGKAAAGLVVGYGLIGLPGSDGQTTFRNSYGGGLIMNGLYHIRDAVTGWRSVISSSDSYWAPTRAAVGAGAAIGGITYGVKRLAPRFSRWRIFRFKKG